MKILNKLFLLTLLTSVVACGDKKEKRELETQIEDGIYVGELSVDQHDGTFYTQENVEVKIENTPEGKVKIIMYAVKFSPRMPVTLDMTINDVAKEATLEEHLLTGDNIIPIAMGGDFPQHTITQLQGTVSAEELSLSMNCGESPLTFSGAVKK